MLKLQSTRHSDRNPTASSRIDTVARLLMREKSQQLVISELRHRTKNLLSVVLAIAHQTGHASPDLESFQSEFGRRLSGLSHSMDLLVADGGHGAPVLDLVHCQLVPFGNVDGTRISANGPDLFLNRNATQNIGLALHELATNAMKYGALSLPEGSVSVAWQVEADASGSVIFKLIWRERGGPKVTPPQHGGFGQIVLQRMTEATLGARVSHEFHPGGVVWSLELPASSVVMPSSGDSVLART